MSWEEYLLRLVTSYREDFSKLSKRIQDAVRSQDFDNTLLEPCQIEVLDTPWKGRVVWLIVHDKDAPDMMFRVHENTKTVDASEFVSRYQFFDENLIRRNFESPLKQKLDHIDVHWKDKFRTFLYRDTQPERIASAILESSLRQVESQARERQYLIISDSAERLKEKLHEDKKESAEGLSAYSQIQSALDEIRRLDNAFVKLEKKFSARIDQLSKAQKKEPEKPETNPLRDFARYISLVPWGLFGTVIVFFPLANNLVSALPVVEGFGNLVSTLAFLVSAFCIFFLFSYRSEISRKKDRQVRRDGAILFFLGIAFISSYLILYFVGENGSFGYAHQTIDPPSTGSPIHLLFFEIPLYVLSFTLTTASFNLLALKEFLRKSK